MKLGLITCCHMFRIYGYRTPEPFDWLKMENDYRESYGEKEFLALASEMHEMGFRHLDIWEPMLSHRTHGVSVARAAGEALRDMGYESVSYCIGGWRGGDGDKVPSAYAFAEALGARVMLGAIEQAAAEELFPIMEREGQRSGIRFGVENHPDPWIGTVEALRSSIAPYPTLGVNLDTGIFHRMGIDVLAAEEALRERIVHVHLKDTSREKRGAFAIGWGDAPLAALLRRLCQRDFDGMVSLEVEGEGTGDPRDALFRSQGFVRGVCRSIGAHAE